MQSTPNTWALDIETASEGHRATKYTDSKRYYPPKNIKDQVKIDANIAAQKSKAAHTHALHWWTGQVISFALVNINVRGDRVVCCLGDKDVDERQLLKSLAETVGSSDTIVTKGGDGFDVPFLIGRFLHHGLVVPRFLKSSSNHIDVDKFFGWSMSSGQRSTLEAYAHGLGIDGKEGLTGADVPGLYNRIMLLKLEGKQAEADELWDQIRKYNLQDSDIVSEIAYRYGVR